MKLLIASYIRQIVSFISLGNLKEYLAKSISILPNDSIIKVIINKEVINNKNLTLESLKDTYRKLKDIVKSYDISFRPPFQKLFLEPIQNAFDKTKFFDPTSLFRTLNKEKEILRKKEEELAKSKEVIKDVSTIPFPRVL